MFDQSQWPELTATINHLNAVGAEGSIIYFNDYTLLYERTESGFGIEVAPERSALQVLADEPLNLPSRDS